MTETVEIEGFHYDVEADTIKTLVKHLRDQERVNDRLTKIFNTPIYGEFLTAVEAEAKHQEARWGPADANKTFFNWYWLVGHLAGKALHAFYEGRTKKVYHHLITTAAAVARWYATEQRRNG